MSSAYRTCHETQHSLSNIESEAEAVSPVPPQDSNISLREITENDWRAVANLHVSAAKAGNLAPNPMSMVEAHYSEDAWKTIVGFLIKAIWPPTDGYHIWRFTIDLRFQGLSFGRQVVRIALRHVKDAYPQAKQLGVMSTPREGKVDVEAHHSLYESYAKVGFRQIAEPDEDGEVMMMVDL